ncbi:hypothetical protein INT48_004302 [Thamnidium elegans]|uniref:Uncharacterized protein n=1 Tax=Thamnidium elegans TaxID=101142 RepID=A0A8H7VYE1_9FUNG|nr:hypothetical protein INT48_004302 [Thamnidium elegans]
MNLTNSIPCLLQTTVDMQHFQPQAEDILTDEDLLELFRIIKQIIRKKPDAERIAKLFFCIVYAMGDLYHFYKPIHSDCIIFRDESNTILGPVTADVRLPSSVSCCQNSLSSVATPPSSSTTSSPAAPTLPVPQRLLSVSYLTHPTPTSPQPKRLDEVVTTDQFSVRPYTNLRPIYPSHGAAWSPLDENQSTRFPHLNTLMNGTEVLMEPKQRGFYYQDGRINREPALLQRYAEQGVLTQASLMRKRKSDDYPYEITTNLPTQTKKPKIPHRHGEFKQRRDRMRSIMMADLEQKSQKLPTQFTLSIEKVELASDINVDNLSSEEARQLLSPALRILTLHSNMKPHLDNGMNQNGIYYNNDYFRLYLAFVQFQSIFASLFPNEVIKIAVNEETMTERDKDRERNANMKAYRVWIEPYLAETNWAAFRRNIMVGERIMQLTKVVGQGILLMTKELSGSKLHLTFTNNEWDEFIQGLSQGTWDKTIDWSHEEDITETEGCSLLVTELRLKFATHFWFTEQGTVVPSAERKVARAKERSKTHNTPNT